MLVSKLDEKAELVDITVSEEQMDLIRTVRSAGYALDHKGG